MILEQKPQKMAALTRKLTSLGYRVQDTYRLGKRVFLYKKINPRNYTKVS